MHSFCPKTNKSRSKFDEKALECYFLGYDELSPCHLGQDLQTNTAFAARKVICKESETVPF